MDVNIININISVCFSFFKFNVLYILFKKEINKNKPIYKSIYHEYLFPLNLKIKEIHKGILVSISFICALYNMAGIEYKIYKINIGTNFLKYFLLISTLLFKYPVDIKNNGIHAKNNCCNIV